MGNPRGRPPHTDNYPRLAYPDITSDPHSIAWLWDAVLEQAKKDLKHPVYIGESQDYWEVKREAGEFLQIDSEDLEMVCALAGVRPEYILLEMQMKEENGKKRK